MNINERTKKILFELNKDIYEKEEVIALTFLSAIAGESIFLLGAPGVAKSLIARRLKYAFENGKSFEYLMNRFSTPDEIFGPVSITKLKDDKYERLTDKYLPTSNVVFLDEIWKAGPSIQNSLLTVLNEKIYRNGDKEEKVDIRAILSASNELPEPNQGLEALWDRFLIRYFVDGIDNIQSFNHMISKPMKDYNDYKFDEKLKIKDDEFSKWTDEIDEILIPNEVLNIIQVIRRNFDLIKKDEDKIYVSDRRWRKIVRILRTSAFLNNRIQVDLMDCFLIAHCIWDKPEQFLTIKEIVAKSIKEYGYSREVKSGAIILAIKDFENEVNREISTYKMVKTELPTIKKVNGQKYYEILNLKEKRTFCLENDVVQLKSNDDKTVTIYAEDGKEIEKRQYVQKTDRKKYIKIDIKGDNNYVYFELESSEEKQVFQKPNHRLVREWNKLVTQIKTDIQKEIDNTENYRKEQLYHLQTNLFVDKRLSQYVEGNITEVINDLQQLKLQVEKIKHSYETIK